MCHAPFTGWVLAARVYRKGGCNCNHRVISIPRLAFQGLEPYDGNPSRTALRGLAVINHSRELHLFYKLPKILWFSIFSCYPFSMARVLLDNEEFIVTSTFTGKFKVKKRGGAYTRKTSKMESMHFHGIIDCLTLLGIPTEPKNEIFNETVSTFAKSLLNDGNKAYRDYFSTPPHEHAYQIVKRT